jgi:hypothetical protein
LRKRVVLWSQKRGFAERNIATVSFATHGRVPRRRRAGHPIVLRNFRVKGRNGIGCSRVMNVPVVHWGHHRVG